MNSEVDISQNLPLLQNLMKRDPDSYKDDFISQLKEYENIMSQFQVNPSSHDERLISLVIFIAQVSHCYKDLVNEFIKQLMDMLTNQGPQLDADMRMSFCKALILLRNKGLVPATGLLQLFFRLFGCPDKVLRKTLYNYIVQDIKNVNNKQKNQKLNTELQNYMYTMLQDSSPVAAKMSLDIMIELYRRNIWNNAKTVNVITTALFLKDTKTVVSALKFFLGSDEAKSNNSDSDNEHDVDKKSHKDLMLAHRVGKKSKKRQKRLDRALELLKKHKKKHKPETFNFSAIHLIHDPQDLSEKLYKQIDQPARNDRFEVKLMKLNFISRLVGIHQLILFQLYPFFDRFLKPSQLEVTKILLYLAQACHEVVPPEIIQDSIRTLANNFITERNSNEVMAVGLNAVREICARCPLAMTQEMLDDLVLYKKSKDKSVLMAARSLIGLFREKNPHLLHKSDRGRPTEAMKEVKVAEYGELVSKDFLPGAEILRDSNEIEQEVKEQDDWESCSENDDNSDDGSWVDVSHSSDEEQNTEEAKKVFVDQSEREEKARSIVQSRILTQEEHKKIQARQIEKETNTGKKTKFTESKKRSYAAMNEDSVKRDGELVSLADIEGIHKKRRHDREARLATVMAGRDGRGKFGLPNRRSNPHASTSNQDKLKKKNFMMVRQKISKKKSKRSFQDKKDALKRALLKKMHKSKK